jgi:hypothetical protein
MPRYHQVDGSTFFLDRDANVSVDEREDGRELVKLTGTEAYGLLTFMRLPGVATLIEQADAAEQDPIWRGYESDEREEMTRKAAYELLVKDQELLTLLGKHIGKDYVLTPCERRSPSTVGLAPLVYPTGALATAGASSCILGSTRK